MDRHEHSAREVWVFGARWGRRLPEGLRVRMRDAVGYLASDGMPVAEATLQLDVSTQTVPRFL